MSKYNPKYLPKLNAATRARRARRKLAAVALLGGSCTDCGFSDLDRLEVFQFDHLPGFEKHNDLTKMFVNRTWEQVEEELAKCELVCANCHATRTVTRSR